MAESFLKKVGKEKLKEVEKAKKKMPQEKLLAALLTLPPVRNFAEALYRSPSKGLIAEIKRRVPNSRSWKPKLTMEKAVAGYVQGGARAISVVTDEKYFGGKLSMIEEIKKLAPLPILRKDFIVDPYQVYESRAARADALLLIAALLPERSLGQFVSLTSGLGMTPVVEVHTAMDLKRTLRAGADVILINNRDLGTQKVNLTTVTRLAKAIPKDNLVIAASGYSSPQSLGQVSADRVRAFLIGRALLESRDPETLSREFIQAAALL